MHGLVEGVDDGNDGTVSVMRDTSISAYSTYAQCHCYSARYENLNLFYCYGTAVPTDSYLR